MGGPMSGRRSTELLTNDERARVTAIVASRGVNGALKALRIDTRTLFFALHGRAEDNEFISGNTADAIRSRLDRI